MHNDEHDILDILDDGEDGRLVEYNDDDDDDDLVQIMDEQLTREDVPIPSHPPIPTQILTSDAQIMPPPPLPPTPAAVTATVPSLSQLASITPSASAPSPVIGSLTERTTRSSTNPYSTRRQAPKKLKLKLSAKAAAQAPTASFLGAYDRELDSDAEDDGKEGELLFEEHFILRMHHGDDCERLRKMVASRDIANDVWFKFKDSRRAQFHIGKNTYSAKLVDLPCIVESQKTFDNKHMFKVADISQMLVVEDKINPSGPAQEGNKSFNVDEFIWPHGLTPPLRWVRKRRFRKRVNKRTIETVEEEVERLLSEDALADSVKYEVLENVNPDLSDSEFIDRPDQPQDAGTPLAFGSDAGDAPTPAATGEEPDLDLERGSDDGDDGEGEGDEDIDEDLAAELEHALGSQGSDENDSDEDEDDEEGDGGEEDEEEEEDDDDDNDNAEDRRAKKLLNEEIRDLEAAVTKKSMEIERSLNPLIKRRFEDALRKLRTDLDLKLAQRTQLDEKRRARKEDGEEADEGEAGPGGGDDEMDDLFGAEPAPKPALSRPPPVPPPIDTSGMQVADLAGDPMDVA